MNRFLPSLLLFSLCFLTAQAQQWQDFTSQSRVKNIDLSGDMVNVATMGGMIQYNRKTGEHHLYTKANSGLSSDAVEVIKTDEMGTIWIGTYDAGVTVYDGQTWKIYNKDNSPLPGNVILTLAIDNDNNKWIGTNNGLVKISDNGWTIYDNLTSPMTDDDIWAMDIANDGSIWLGCVTGSYRLKDAEWTDYSAQVPMYGVNGMACMPSGEVLTSGVGGVFSYKDGKWTDISANGPDGLRNARKAVRTANGDIWVATDYAGLYHYDGTNWTGGTNGGDAKQFSDNGTIALDADGSIITASVNGISRFTGKTWEQLYQPAPGLYDNYVRAVASDLMGNIWVAHTNSVGRYNGSEWTYLTPGSSPLPQATVYHIRTEKPGTVWFCTSGGLARVSGGQWKIFDRTNTAFFTNEILDADFDTKGNTWVSHERGLSCYDGTSWKHYGQPAQFAQYERGTVLKVDMNNTVWMGTNAGNIFSFINGQWKRYSFDDKTFPGGYVMDLTVDYAGKLWAATWGSDACYFDGASWMSVSGTSTVSASAILSAKNGLLWTGASYPAGLTGYKDGTIVKSFNNDNSPISGRTVNALTEDEKGNIWIGTSSGLVVYRSDASAGMPMASKTQLEISLYPNPAHGKTSLSINAIRSGKAELRVIDLTGKTLLTETHTINAGKNVLPLETSTFSDGTYVVEVNMAGSTSRQKLVVMP